MTKKYLKEHNLLAFLFDKSTGICLMESQAYENKAMAILESKQFWKMEKACKNAKEFCLKEEQWINTVLEELNERCKVDEQFLNWLSTG